jgi:enoyl-CoA hydratase/carnithine racemase
VPGPAPRARHAWNAIAPCYEATHFLVQRVGFGRASEMCLSGRLYGAAEAHAIGLADHLCPAPDLEARAFEIAGEMAKNPDPQLRMIKELLGQNGAETDLVAAEERETAMLRECWKSAEHREAVQAFLEKRPPRFR